MCDSLWRGSWEASLEEMQRDKEFMDNAFKPIKPSKVDLEVKEILKSYTSHENWF